jgi:hypothetical protein
VTDIQADDTGTRCPYVFTPLGVACARDVHDPRYACHASGEIEGVRWHAYWWPVRHEDVDAELFGRAHDGTAVDTELAEMTGRGGTAGRSTGHGGTGHAGTECSEAECSEAEFTPAAPTPGRSPGHSGSSSAMHRSGCPSKRPVAA